MDRKLQRKLLEAQIRASQQAALHGSSQPNIVSNTSASPAPNQMGAVAQPQSEWTLIKKDTWFSLGLVVAAVLIFIALHFADKQYGFLLDAGNYIFGFLK